MSSLFKPVAVEQAAAKVGIFGPQGSGKTTTAALILIGLSLTYHKGAPVFMLDTENGSDYLEEVFRLEGVPLLVGKSRAFKDMRGGLIEAEAAGAIGYLVDSYSHPWKELTDSFKAKSRRKKLEFHHMDELKSMWGEWTVQMLNSPAHVLLCGRLGYVWDREEDSDDGEKGDLIKLGTKMKSESEAGYEPSLLVEMEGLQADAARMKKTRAKRGTITHHAYVLKDRWRSLNGLTFAWPDINRYKKGDYARVFEAFKPHFSKLAIGTSTQRAVSATRTSSVLFERGDAAEFGRRRDIALDEIKENIAAVFPGQTAQDKRFRQVVLETLFATLSWTKVETLKLEDLERAVLVLREFREQAAKDRNQVTSEAGVSGLLVVSRDVVANAAALAQDDDVPVA